MEEKPKHYRGGLAPRDLRRALEFIEAAPLDEPLSIAAIAEHVGRGQCYFQRAFRESVGQSPHQYIIDRKLAIAVDRLKKEEDLALVDLALDLGFSSQSHFSTVFSRRIGITPSDFHRGQDEVALPDGKCKCPTAGCPFRVQEDES